MLKDPTVRTFVCWIGTMFLLTVFVLAFSPLHTPVCGDEYQAAHQQCPTYNIIVAALMDIGRNSDIVAAIITALATVTIANFTVKLVEVTNRQAALSKDALIVGNAALVFVQDIKW